MLIRLRRDTAAAWAAVNPTLVAGEPGIDATAGALKLGDGVTPWAGLADIVTAGLAAAYPAGVAPASLGANVSNGAPAPLCYLEPGGWVDLEGQIVLGAVTFAANTVLMTLAVPFRPPAIRVFLVRTIVGNAQSNLKVNPDGTVTNVSSITATGTDTINLDGMRYRHA